MPRSSRSALADSSPPGRGWRPNITQEVPLRGRRSSAARSSRRTISPVQSRLWHIRQLDEYADIAALRDVSPHSAMSRPTRSVGRWPRRSTRLTTPKPPRINSDTPPRRSPSGITSTAVLSCRTTERSPSGWHPTPIPQTVRLSRTESPGDTEIAPCLTLARRVALGPDRRPLAVPHASCRSDLRTQSAPKGPIFVNRQEPPACISAGQSHPS